METLLIPRDEIRQILVDMEKFLDLGLWGYFFNALAQLEEILKKDASAKTDASIPHKDIQS
jgi:hypothetical protein